MRKKSTFSGAVLNWMVTTIFWPDATEIIKTFQPSRESLSCSLPSSDITSNFINYSENKKHWDRELGVVASSWQPSLLMSTLLPHHIHFTHIHTHTCVMHMSSVGPAQPPAWFLTVFASNLKDHLHEHKLLLPGTDVYVYRDTTPEVPQAAAGVFSPFSSIFLYPSLFICSVPLTYSRDSTKNPWWEPADPQHGRITCSYFRGPF